MMKRHRREHRRHTKKQAWYSKFGRFLRIFMALISLTILITPLYAAEDRVGEGVKDITRGTFAVPAEVAKTSNESNIINGLVVGTAKGVVNTFVGIGKGVVKILTFYPGGEKIEESWQE